MIAATLAFSVWMVSTGVLSLVALAALDHAKRKRNGDWQDWQ